MPSLRPLFALAALGLLSKGANATPCKPITTTTIASAVASATTSETEANTSTIDVESSTATTGVTTTEDSTTTVIVEESTTTEAEATTTTAEATTTTAEATTTTAEATTTAEETTTTAEATTTTAEASTTATVCQVAVETNYFRNPSFDAPEPSSDTEIANWGQWSHAYFLHSSAGKPARTGNYKLEVDVSRPLEDMAGEIFQDVTGLTAGKWYRISTWVAPTYVDDANWSNRCYVSVKAGTQQLNEGSIEWADAGEYAEMTFDFQATVSDIKVLFYIGCDYASFHVDRFLFDDFALHEICPAEGQ